MHTGKGLGKAAWVVPALGNSKSTHAQGTWVLLVGDAKDGDITRVPQGDSILGETNLGLGYLL